MKKNLSRLAAIAMTGLMVLGMSFSALAVDAGAVSEHVAVGFNKTLAMSDTTASVPVVTFNYTIEPGEAVAATSTSPEIKAGIGTPGIGNAAFTAADTAAAQVVKPVSLDFSNVTFTEPGIYRYIITEGTNANDGITYDTNLKRYLDVYVGNNGKIFASTLTSEAGTPTLSEGNDGTTATYQNKSDGFTNTYTTYSLTLNKLVAGNMASKTQRFPFTVQFANATDITVKYTITRASGAPAPETGVIQVTATGENKANIELADGDTVVFSGLPSTASYTIDETTPDSEGYTITVTGNATADAATVTIGADNDTVTYTNTKNNITPTGVVLDIAPYAIMVLVAGFAAVMFLRRRSYED